jgi:uncharacterized alpha-E superfamily protein
VQDVFAQGLHEYLTDFLADTGRLSNEINTAFFAPTLPTATARSQTSFASA